MPLRPDSAAAPTMELLAGARYSSTYQLNPLWERVVKTQRLPPEVDLQEVFQALKHRLRDPEKEVRQHALRVLVDLVPVLRSSLDVILVPLLADLLQNLGHPAPAVRKGALDALRMYVSHSDDKKFILTEICTKCLEKNAINDKCQEDVTMGVILAMPSLLQPTLGYIDNSSDVIISVVKALSSKLFQMIYQEVAIRSLVRIREIIGPKVFEDHIRSLDPSVTENLNLLCKVYEIPISIEANPSRADQDADRNNDCDSILLHVRTDEMFISEPPTELLNSENNLEAFQPTIMVDVDNSHNIPNGKIILETEFSFDSQTAITMTILEEDEAVTNSRQQSEEDSFDHSTYNKSVVKVLTDSEVEEYEVRRTPRRVRFGGEIVKMRTPDSDTLQNSDADEIIEISANANQMRFVKLEKQENKNEADGNVDKSSKDSPAQEEKVKETRINQEEKVKEEQNKSDTTKTTRSMIPLPVEPITTRPTVRKHNRAGGGETSASKKKSKSLNDLSTYCKQQFGVSAQAKGKSVETKKPMEKTKSFIPLKSYSKDDVRVEEFDELNKKQRFLSIIPLEDLDLKIGPDAVTKLYAEDDYTLGDSSTNSTGSGSSSDNPVDDTLEELSIFSDDIFKDLYKVDGQRGAFQTLDKLTSRLNNNSEFGPSLDPQQVQVLAKRLGTLAGKARGRAGEAALQALRALVKTASDKSLRGALHAVAGALAGAGLRSQGLLADVGRRIPAADLVDALLDEQSPHWRSTKLRAGALRTVSYAARTLPCSGVRVTWACSRCAACARSSRRRVRAAALDALATLARLSSPRAVLAAVHKEAADHDDGDQLYDAVLARLCRPAAPGSTPAIPAGSTGPSHSGTRRPDLAWVMAGVGDASPPPSHKVQRTGDEWIHRARGGSSAPEGPASLATPLYTSRVTPSAGPRSQQELAREEQLYPARVLTAPPVALRPITLPALAPPVPPGQPPMSARAVLWASHPPSHIDIHWGQKQDHWPALGGSWPRCQQLEAHLETWADQGGPTSKQSPSQHQVKWGWSHTQGMREDGFSPHEPPRQPFQTPAGILRHNPEGLNFPRQHYPASAILLTIHNKIEENGENTPQRLDTPSTVSIRDTKSPTGSTASLAVSISSERVKANGSVQSGSRMSNHAIQTSPYSHVEERIPSPHVSPVHSSHSAASAHTLKHSIQDSTSLRSGSYHAVSPSKTQQPPTVDDFDDDDGVAVMAAPEPMRSLTPSPQRFINKQDSEEHVEYFEEQLNTENERFINLKEEPEPYPRDAPDNVSAASAKFSSRENLSRSPAVSVRSQKIPTPDQDVRGTPSRTNVASAPAISYLGSSVSTEEEVKSVESGFSEQSLRESLTSVDNDKENQIKDVAIIQNKTNITVKKPPKKITRLIPKSVNSKITRNRIQPSQSLATNDKPLERPKEVLSKSLVQLESCDWETVMSGLHGMESLVKYHGVFLETHLTPVCRTIAAQIKNLRSQVARAACRLAGNLFLSQRKAIESEADELAVPLLSRTADTNKFLRIDANEALDKMCDSISLHRSICIIMSRGAAHQNAIVRCTSARLLGNIATGFGPERLFGIQKEIRDKLIQTGADLLTEGSLETRGHAKQLFKVLSQNPQFVRILRDTIPLSKYRSIEKALNNIRGH